MKPIAVDCQAVNIQELVWNIPNMGPSMFKGCRNIVSVFPSWEREGLNLKFNGSELYASIHVPLMYIVVEEKNL